MGVAKTVGASAALATGMAYTPATIGTLGTLGKGLLSGAVVDQGFSLLGGRPANIGEIGLGAGATMGMPLIGKGLVKGWHLLNNTTGSYLGGIKKSFLKSYDNRSIRENIVESFPLTLKTITNPKLARQVSTLPDGIVRGMKDMSSQDIKKRIYTFNKIKKSGIPIGNPSEIFTTLKENPSFTNLQSNMTDYLTQPIVEMENLKRAGLFESYLSRDFNSKLDKIANPDLREIVKTSPQYIEEVYEHSINPKTTNEEFVNNLVKRANTFQRWSKTPNSSKELLELKGSSMGFNGKQTIDVDGIVRSGDYGNYGYLFEPNAEFLGNIQNLPLSEK